MLSGLALIVAGVVCLYLSDKVVTGWWQGTLDAFGVGFVVGGMVDVLAITVLNQALAEEQKRRENDSEAKLLLRDHVWAPDRLYKARELLLRSEREIDPQLRAQLLDLVADDEGQGSSPQTRPRLGRFTAAPQTHQTRVTLPRHPETPEPAIRRGAA